ncbi:hypothetical protein EMCRGX_G032518 [Ephydatia muelleri]|eukprot:Em0019g190a
MSSIGTGYDLSASQFSPDGRVFQIEYAAKAVENSGTAVALRGKDGVVFAVEKLVTSKLHEPGSNKLIFTVDEHIGVAVSGLIADGRQVVHYAREEASQYRLTFDQPIPIKNLVDRIAGIMHVYTLYSNVRPFGCTLMIGTYENEAPKLFMAEPSGVSWGYHACAVGKAKQAAKTEIEKLKVQEMTCQQLIKEAAKIIYAVHDEVKDKAFELELSWVGEVTGGKHQRVPLDVFEEAERYAKEALKEADTEDEDL